MQVLYNNTPFQLGISLQPNVTLTFFIVINKGERHSVISLWKPKMTRKMKNGSQKVSVCAFSKTSKTAEPESSTCTVSSPIKIKHPCSQQKTLKNPKDEHVISFQKVINTSKKGQCFVIFMLTIIFRRVGGEWSWAIRRRSRVGGQEGTEFLFQVTLLIVFFLTSTGTAGKAQFSHNVQKSVVVLTHRVITFIEVQRLVVLGFTALFTIVWQLCSVHP